MAETVFWKEGGEDMVVERGGQRLKERVGREVGEGGRVGGRRRHERCVDERCRGCWSALHNETARE